MGRIEVICGSMFSGKTEELINRIKKSKKSYKVFKPNTDTRNKKNKIKSHSKVEIDATTINNVNDITKELTPIINSLVIKSTSKNLSIPFEKYNKNHSDKPR